MGKFRINTREFNANVRKLLAKNQEKVRAAMTDAGHFLRSEIQLRTPIDEGMLTANIRFDVLKYKKSYATALYVASNAASSNYAVRMHEGTYRLGPHSASKQSKVSVKVGRKYITRAIDDNTRETMEVIVGRLKL